MNETRNNAIEVVTQQSLLDTIKDSQVQKTIESINKFQAIVKSPI